MSFYIDLTEFLTNPMMTGIQRVTGEMCRRLPPNSAVPLRLYLGQYLALPPELITAIGEYFKEGNGSGLAKVKRLGAIDKGSPAEVSKTDTVLVPEFFFDPHRIAFFRAMSEEELQRYRFIVYDLLPLTHPEYFAADLPMESIHGYFSVIGRGSCGFISVSTREAYYKRLKRSNSGEGIVLPLGCNSLGPRAGAMTFNRRLLFSVIGTIEPRKNHRLVLEAFEPLLRQNHALRVAFVGKMGWVDSELVRKIEALASIENSGFEFLRAPNDELIRAYIEQSRATIYVSAAEGYGLPPVESLWLGTPVIASHSIPSLEAFGSRGVHIVNPLNVLNLRKAIVTFLEDGYSELKIAETAQLSLPTWRSFTEEVLRWCGLSANIQTE